jgi:hypothetical protein
MSHFGVEPEVAAKAWHLIVASYVKETELQASEPWAPSVQALMLLKPYGSQSVMTSHSGAKDEKKFRN